MPAVLKLDPGDERLAPLVPFAAQRLRQHAESYMPEVKPEEYARGMIARLWAGDQNLLLLVLVDEESAALVGHVLAQKIAVTTAVSVLIEQVRADENVGDALVQAVEQVIKWAHGQHITRVLMNTHRDGKEWVKRLGFQRYRSVLRLPLDGDAHGG